MGIGAKTGRWNKFAHLPHYKSNKKPVASQSQPSMSNFISTNKMQKFDARQNFSGQISLRERRTGKFDREQTKARMHNSTAAHCD